MDRISQKLKFTILSISLLTVMAGAVVAPALGLIQEQFSSQPEMLIQFVVSLPALFIILTSMFFPFLCRFFRTRTIAVFGLLLYVAGGCGAFMANSIFLLLLLRALLGVSVGLIMPLSTGLLTYYYPPEQLPGLMGLSAAMNQMGGVIATLLAGLLANISWHYAFLVYSMGLIALVMVLMYLPNEKLRSKTAKFSPKTLLKFHPSVVGMFLLMCIFFIYPTNFALTASRSGLSPNMITFLMVGLDIVAFFAGLLFGRLMARYRIVLKYFAPILFLMGCLVLSFDSGIVSLTVASVLIGMANGVGVPYLNTIASLKGGKEATTTVMPLLSASLYLGQFISPIIVSPLSQFFFGSDIRGCYKIGIAVCLIFLLQTFLTRSLHSLTKPAESHDSGQTGI